MENSSPRDEFKKAKDELVLFGIPEREASIYFSLLERGESKAGELAAKLGLHRLDVYHDLKTLQSKDMVEGTITKPMKFKAIPLHITLEVLQKKDQEFARSRTNALSDLRKISEDLKTRDLPKENVSGNKIQIIGGQKTISEKWISILEHAKSEILVAAIDKGSAKVLLMRGMEEISKKMKAGVNVRIFTPVTQSNTDQFKEVASEVRHLDSINSAGVCIVDRKEVMIIPEASDDPSSAHPDETAIIITSPSIVEMFRVLFFVGWDTSPATGDSR